MLRINTFGGLWLERDGQRVEAATPRRSALLAVLATAGNRGVSRDRLLLYLWPDSPEERARHSLAQTIYSLHRSVGVELIESVGPDLRLTDASTSDVGDFLAAHAAGDMATMIAGYRGPFLDGFILSDAAEFDAWAAAERTRFEQLARDALESSARRAEQSGSPDATALWRRLTTLDPLATRYAIGLARSLAQQGDPGGAVRHLRDHERWLRSEVGAAPPDELKKLIADLATRSGSSLSTTPEAPPAAQPSAAAPASPPVPATLSPVPSADPAVATTDTRPAAPSHRRRWPLVAAGAVVLLIATAAAALLSRRPVKTLRGGAMVVLADLENLTPDSTLGPALLVATSIGLQQSSGFSLYQRSRLSQSLRRLGRTIPDTVLSESLAREIALREAGHAVVVVSIATLDQQLILAGRIVEPTSGLVLAAHRETAPSRAELLTSLDQLVRWIRGRLGDTDWSTAPPLPAVTTPSLPALGAFAEARQALVTGRYQLVAEAALRALAADTGFAAAQALLGQFYIFSNQVPQGLNWLRQAAIRSDRLTEPEQLAIKSALANAEGRLADEVAAQAELTARFPSAWAWEGYGEALRRSNHHQEAIAAFERALALDSTFSGSMLGIALSLRSAGDLRGAIDAYDRLWRADSTVLLRDFFNQQWGAVFVDVGDMTRAEDVFRKMLASPDRTSQARGHRSLAYLAMYRGQFAAAAEHLRTALAIYGPVGQSPYRDWLLLADAEMTRGETAAANGALDKAFGIFRAMNLQAGFVMLGGHQMVRAGRLPQARLMLDSLRARAALRPNHPQDRAAVAILEADIALAENQPAKAAQALAVPSFAEFWTLGSSLRTEALEGTGKLDSALALARAVADTAAFGVEDQQEWFRSFGRLARVAEASGDSATARAAYSTLLEKWKAADSTLPMLRNARRELARLQTGSGR